MDGQCATFLSIVLGWLGAPDDWYPQFGEPRPDEAAPCARADSPAEGFAARPVVRLEPHRDHLGVLILGCYEVWVETWVPLDEVSVAVQSPTPIVECEAFIYGGFVPGTGCQLCTSNHNMAGFELGVLCNAPSLPPGSYPLGTFQVAQPCGAPWIVDTADCSDAMQTRYMVDIGAVCSDGQVPNGVGDTADSCAGNPGCPDCCSLNN